MYIPEAGLASNTHHLHINTIPGAPEHSPQQLGVCVCVWGHITFALRPTYKYDPRVVPPVPQGWRKHQ